jgi:O-acetylserine/cysteine efflux transporter
MASLEAAGRSRPAFGRADLYVLFTALVWGATYPVAKPIVAAVDPFFFSAMRYIVAAALLFVVMAASGQSLRVERRDLLPLLGLGLLGYTAFQGIWGFALVLTTAAKGSILISTTPVFGALFARLRGERLGAAGWAGVLLAFAGVYLVVSNGAAGPDLGGGALLGDALFVLNAAVWALFTSTSAPVVARLGAVRTMAWSALLGSLILLPLGLPDALAEDWSAVPPGLGWNFAFLSAISGAAGLLAYYAGLRRLGVARSMVYLYLIPVFAAAIAILFLGESLSAAQAAGGCAVLAGIALARGAARGGRA